jgi:hypothetical protein
LLALIELEPDLTLDEVVGECVSSKFLAVARRSGFSNGTSRRQFYYRCPYRQANRFAACRLQRGLQADSFRRASHGRYQVPNESDLAGEDVAQDQKNAVESLV